MPRNQSLLSIVGCPSSARIVRTGAPHFLLFWCTRARYLKIQIVRKIITSFTSFRKERAGAIEKGLNGSWLPGGGPRFGPIQSLQKYQPHLQICNLSLQLLQKHNLTFCQFFSFWDLFFLDWYLNVLLLNELQKHIFRPVLTLQIGSTSPTFVSLSIEIYLCGLFLTGAWFVFDCAVWFANCNKKHWDMLRIQKVMNIAALRLMINCKFFAHLLFPLFWLGTSVPIKEYFFAKC